MNTEKSLFPVHESSASERVDPTTAERARQFAMQLHERGLSNLALTVSDIFEPFGLIGAQLMIVAQPAFRLFGAAGWGAQFGEWAAVLESPEGAIQLRAQLELLQKSEIEPTPIENPDPIVLSNSGD